MDPKTKKILVLAGAGAIGLFVLTRSSGQEDEAAGSQLMRTPLTFPQYPSGAEAGTPITSGAPNISYNLPSFPAPASIPSFDYGFIAPQEFFSEPDAPSTKKEPTSTFLIRETTLAGGGSRRDAVRIDRAGSMGLAPGQTVTKKEVASKASAFGSVSL